MTAQAPAHKASNALGIAEGALLADLTVVVVLLGLYVPYAGAAMAAFSPIPLLLLVLRRGWRITAEAMVVACILVGFLTGPFSAAAVLVLAARAAALGIGLRRLWPVRKTVLVGTMFLWGVVWVAVTTAALAFPSWRVGTEQGVRATYRALSSLAGVILHLCGLGRQWAQVLPQLNDMFSWVLAHWLLLLPVFIWPVLLIAVGAEYVIAEVVLPRFGIEPPPMQIPWLGLSVRYPVLVTATGSVGGVRGESRPLARFVGRSGVHDGTESTAWHDN